MPIVLPLLIAMLGGILGIIFGRAPLVRRFLSITVIVSYAISGFVLLVQVNRFGTQIVKLGGWDIPVGISFRADQMSAAFVAVTGIVALCTMAYQFGSHDARKDEVGASAIMSFLLMGVTGVFLTNDLFNLYVWFEVILLSSFILHSLTGTRRAIRSALHYVLMNLMGSMMFLTALGLIYAQAKVLDMTLLATAHVSGVSVTLLFCAFAIKAAVFPFSAWLPASYPAAPVATAAVFAGLLTKVGIYCFYRVFTVSPHLPLTTELAAVIPWLALFSGLIGGLAALTQNDIRRCIAFLLASHVGLMMLGVTLGTKPALAYTLQHMVVITALYLIVGYIVRVGGSYKLSELGGMGRTTPWLGSLFFVAGLALIGVPPFSGFAPKVGMLQMAFAAESDVAMATIVVVGVLTLAAVIRIWQNVFWGESPEEPVALQDRKPRRIAMVVPMVVLLGISLVLGLAVTPFYTYTGLFKSSIAVETSP